MFPSVAVSEAVFRVSGVVESGLKAPAVSGLLERESPHVLVLLVLFQA